MDFSLSRYDGLRERCAPIQAKLRDFPFNQLLQIVAAAPKSRLSGLTSSRLQACGVGFRWTRRTCFLRSFDLTFLVPPFAAVRSLASGCRLGRRRIGARLKGQCAHRLTRTAGQERSDASAEPDHCVSDGCGRKVTPTLTLAGHIVFPAP